MSANLSSHPFKVIARVRPSEQADSCVEVEELRGGKAKVSVAPFQITGSVSFDDRRQSLRRSSVGAGNRKSSIGCSSLIPKTPHTPRGVLRDVLSVFPVMQEAAAKTETFQLSGAISGDGTQADVFNALLPEVTAALNGFRCVVLAYGVAESGKSHTLWGTREEKGFVARALEYVFAHAPQGTKAMISFIGISDNLCLDYLSEGQPTEHEPVFKDGVDGGKFLPKGITTTVSDASGAWEAVVHGLSAMRSDHHQILTINVHVPCPDGSWLVGTLQCGELVLPAADEAMSANIGALHEVVRELVDQNYEGALAYARAPLPLYLQSAFGGNARTTVVATVHGTLPHFHHTIQSLSFAEHCTKLKNMVAPHRVSGVATIAAPSAATGGSTSATNASSAKSVMVASVAANAPADLLRQLNDFRVYSEELETENEELRAKLAAWEERLADGEKRHELARRRLEEQLQTRVIELEKRSKELALLLDAERVVSNGQVLIIARQEALLAKAHLGNAEDTAVPTQVQQLLQRVQDLELANRRLRGGEDVGSAAFSGDADSALRLLKAENEALKRSLAEQRHSLVADNEKIRGMDGDDQLRNVHAKQSTLIARQEAQLREMREEMRLKEEEMRERETTIEELQDRVQFLKSQLNTINFLKASAVPGGGSHNMSVSHVYNPNASTVYGGSSHNNNNNNNVSYSKAPAAAAAKSVAVNKASKDAAAAKAKAIAEAKKRKKAEEEAEARRRRQEEQEEEERRQRELEEEEEEERRRQEAKRQREEEAAEEKRRKEEEQKKKKAAAAKKRRLAINKAKQEQAELEKQQQEEEERKRQEEGEQQQEEEEEVEEQPRRVPPAVAPVPVADDEEEEVEEPAATPVPRARAVPKKAAANSGKKQKAPASKKRVESPNENIGEMEEVVVPAAQRVAGPGRKKLYNGADKRARNGDYRKSLATTPGSAATAPKAGAAALGKLSGGNDYKGLLEGLLDNNLFALNTPK